MSTLRVSNIEAKADASSPSVNEKVKVTNSSGDVLIHVNGETTGITTVGVNTTGKTFDVNANQKVTFVGGLNVPTGLVGVGTDIPSTNLDVVGSNVPVVINSSNSNTYKIQLENAGSTVAYIGAATNEIYFANASAAEQARFTDNGLRFPSGKGIDFSATSDGGTSTPSELLDDYEEGSWDPQILGWNGSYSIQEGRYIKIGRMVHVIGEVRTDAQAGNSFTNAWPGLSNLPFVNTTSFQGVSGSQRCMGYGTILGDVSPGGTNGQAFVTFDRNTGSNAFFPNHISSQGAQNFQNTMINNPTTADFGYRYNCTFYTD